MMIKKEIKNYPLRTMYHLDHAYQNSITHLKVIQKILILLLQCKIC